MAKTPEIDGTARRSVDLSSITKVSFSQVLGLARAVEEAGGEADVARIAAEADMDLDRIGPIVAAAEFLGVLVVEDGNLRSTDFTHRVLKATIRERKAILRDFLRDIPVFRYVIQMIETAGRPASRAEVIEALAVHFGSHGSADLFKALVYWGRASELIAYDARSEQVTVRAPGTPMPPAH